jgi:hypothetical protein
LLLRLIVKAVQHEGAHHKQQDPRDGGPQGSFATEKAVIDRARNEADAAVLQQHRCVLVLERVSHLFTLYMKYT